MANLGNDNLEEEVNADDFLEDFDYLTEKRKFRGKVLDVHPWNEEYANFSGKLKLKEDISILDVAKNSILPFLPAKSLCRFKAVSKEWNQWINNPFLGHLQTTNFKDISGLLCQSPGLDPAFISFNGDAYGIPSPSLKFLPGPVNIMTTCNGLLCCKRMFEVGYYICNPVTKEWTLLPQPKFLHGPETAVALVFEPTALNFCSNFELVCAVPISQNELTVVYFEIYSSRSMSWRTSETICFETDVQKLNVSGFYMKGFVYWTTSSATVLAFDLREEQYGILPVPGSREPHGSLTQMHGEICYIVPQMQGEECMVCVYGNLDMSLKCVIQLKDRLFRQAFPDCRVLTCVDSDVLILLLPNKVIAYQVKVETLKVLSRVDTTGFQTCLPYINSLVVVAK